jgi:hypothetical protein
MGQLTGDCFKGNRLLACGERGQMLVGLVREKDLVGHAGRSSGDLSRMLPAGTDSEGPVAGISPRPFYGLLARFGIERQYGG